MFAFSIAFLLSFVGDPVVEPTPTEATETPTGPEDAAVGSLAGFDLGSISKKDAGDWAVLRLTKALGNGFPVVDDRNEKGFATGGTWERIGSLTPSPSADRAGEYHWVTGEIANFQHYRPLNDGGFILAQHYPKKSGKEQFGTVVVLSEDTAKWVAAAYQFRTKNADLFGEHLDEQRLLKLLGDENPMIAIMAQQRLAKAHSDRLTGKSLGAALGGPADLRLAVAVYLGFAARDEDAAFDYVAKNEGDARVPPEFTSAIKNADAKRLRLYALGISAGADPRVLTANVRVGMKLCRERAETLQLDPKLRNELNDFFSQANLPPLEPK